MTNLTSEIINFYNFNSENNSYLIKYFTDTSQVGFYEPYAKNIFPSDAKNTKWGTVDEHNTYKINHLGLRGEIDENADLIASGCSITFGVGVPEETRWTNLLSKKINKSVTNLGVPGASAETICINTIKYCLNNKMPKEIFCLFPDFFRSNVVVDKDFFKSRHLGSLKLRENLAKFDVLQLIYCNPTIYQKKESLFMEIQDKECIEDSVSPHQLILDSVNFIYILESFCLTNNIKLYWTTWDFNTDLLMRQLLKIKNFKLKNFTSVILPNHNLGFYNTYECDLDHDLEFKNSLWWAKGSDVVMVNGEKGNMPPHPGIHTHLHISDFFYNLHSKNLSNA